MEWRKKARGVDKETACIYMHMYTKGCLRRDETVGYPAKVDTSTVVTRCVRLCVSTDETRGSVQSMLLLRKKSCS